VGATRKEKQISGVDTKRLTKKMSKEVSGESRTKVDKVARKAAVDILLRAASAAHSDETDGVDTRRGDEDDEDLELLKSMEESLSAAASARSIEREQNEDEEEDEREDDLGLIGELDASGEEEAPPDSQEDSDFFETSDLEEPAKACNVFSGEVPLAGTRQPKRMKRKIRTEASDANGDANHLGDLACSQETETKKKAIIEKLGTSRQNSSVAEARVLGAGAIKSLKKQRRRERKESLLLQASQVHPSWTAAKSKRLRGAIVKSKGLLKTFESESET